MRVVVIGGSAGSIDALRQLLEPIPAGLDAAFVTVVHLPPKPPSLLASVLSAYTAMPVHEALDKMPLRPGAVTVAPPDYHVLVEPDFTVSLSRDREVHYSRPAIDTLFESAAEAFGALAIGVLLTGSNEDGAVGLSALHAAGASTAVQDPKTAFAPEMPSGALRRCRPDLVADPRSIGRWLATLLASPGPR